ncbi:leucine-rich repeat protein [Bacteroides sedimenti]|uniref:Leucine-rich repeat domain-containing protein n=2 Tax=Bacteroides sedimenti TaxID=2136147 RepID=A0ABM8I9Z2_9BACE
MKLKQLGILMFLCLSISFATAQTVSKTLFVAKAGTLKEQLTEKEAKSVTHLTITGKLNAKDFKLMRDSLVKLETLDISNASITLYMGREGTYPEKYYVYPMSCIPAYAFCNAEKGTIRGKKSLKKIMLPTSTINIEDCAFKDCSNLTLMMINRKTAPNLLPEALNDSLTAVFIPVGCRDAYKHKKGWEKFAILEGTPETLTISLTKAGELGNEIMKAGHQPSELNYLTIKGSINEDDFKVIRDFMPNLVSLDLSATTATEIPNFTFTQKKYLMSVNLPQKLQVIGERAFSGCIHLSGELLIPRTVTAIKEGAFIDCDMLSKVIVQGDKLSVLGKDLFRETSKQKIEFRK